MHVHQLAQVGALPDVELVVGFVHHGTAGRRYERCVERAVGPCGRRSCVRRYSERTMWRCSARVVTTKQRQQEAIEHARQGAAARTDLPVLLSLREYSYITTCA